MFDSRHRKCLQRIPQCISAGTSQKSSAKSFLYCHIILLLSPGPHKKARRNTPLPVFRENKSSCTPSGQKLYHHIPFIGSSAAPFQLYLLYHRFSHHICDLFAICRKNHLIRRKAVILRSRCRSEKKPASCGLHQEKKGHTQRKFPVPRLMVKHLHSQESSCRSAEKSQKQERPLRNPPLPPDSPPLIQPICTKSNSVNPRRIQQAPVHTVHTHLIFHCFCNYTNSFPAGRSRSLSSLFRRYRPIELFISSYRTFLSKFSGNLFSQKSRFKAVFSLFYRLFRPFYPFSGPLSSCLPKSPICCIIIHGHNILCLCKN